MGVGIAAVAVLSVTIQAQWIQTNGPNGGNINALFASDSQIFAGTDRGILRSTNNGASWSAVTSRATNLNVMVFAVKDSNLFAATNQGVFRSKGL
jgi:photosystem II stability/assembly factor-like uncharacterized protein